MNNSNNDNRQANNNGNVVRNRPFRHLAFGVLLIVAGVVFILFNMNVLPNQWRPIIISWQMLLVAVGVVSLFQKQYTAGCVIIAVGLFFGIPKLSLVGFGNPMFYEQFTHNFWPVLLVILGIINLVRIITNSRRGRFNNDGWDYNRCAGSSAKSSETQEKASQEPFTEGFTSSNSTDENGRINYKFLFSGSNETFLEPVFRGGRITATFGGIELDLRRSALPEGVSVLRIEAVFGGVSLRVPDDWCVEVHSQAFFGGFDDHRSYRGTDKTHKLIIESACTFGGGELKN